MFQLYLKKESFICKWQTVKSVNLLENILGKIQ